jgi:adenylate cyclase
MDNPQSKHTHSPSWDQQQNTSHGGKRRDATHNVHSHQHTGSDSFFNRVFGHHSSDSSRGTVCVCGVWV